MVHRRETFHENLANSNKTAVARPHGALQLLLFFFLKDGFNGGITSKEPIAKNDRNNKNRELHYCYKYSYNNHILIYIKCA